MVCDEVAGDVQVKLVHYAIIVPDLRKDEVSVNKTNNVGTPSYITSLFFHVDLHLI